MITPTTVAPRAGDASTVVTECNALLRLIEAAVADCTTDYFEINARFDALVSKKRVVVSASLDDCGPPEYTRSRDALKKARPPHWLFDILANRNRGTFKCMADGIQAQFWSHELPTEELAEMHAIIQAHAFLRSLS